MPPLILNPTMEVKLDDAVLIYKNKKSFLIFDNCSNRLKAILVTCKQLCSPKRVLFGVFAINKDGLPKHFSRRSIAVSQGTL